MDVELQFIESGRKCRGASALVTAAQQSNKTQVGNGSTWNATLAQASVWAGLDVLLMSWSECVRGLTP